MTLSYLKIGYLAAVARHTTSHAVKQMACSMTMTFLHVRTVCRPKVRFFQPKFWNLLSYYRHMHHRPILPDYQLI